VVWHREREARGRVHFWTLVSHFEEWDPDLEPDRFVTGYGHMFLEMYARLKARGLPVTIGRRVAKGTRALVASLEELTLWRDSLAPGPATRLALAAVRCPTVVLIRGDLPMSIAAPGYIRREVMPTEASITDPTRQVALPPLPQRGLIPREPSRRERIERVALKTYRHNIPDFVLDRGFADQLKTMDIDLRIDTEVDRPFRWHDFRDVDVALCVRASQPKFDTDDRYTRKPPSKLINAWRAGAVPIVAPEASYLELIEEGRNALVASSPDEVVAALQHLRRHPDHVRELLARGRAKSASWTTDAVLEKWEELFISDLPDSNRVRPFISAAAHFPMMVLERLRRPSRR
jgi:Glycosyl transferases group 1